MIIKINRKEALNLNDEATARMLPRILEGSQIPKLIHQTFCDRNSLPKELKDNIEYIKAINPGWEYRLYDDKDIIKFIKENYGDRILQYYLRINPVYGAGKADFFRYLCIYKLGGVYIDIKSTFKKPLDSVIRPDDRFLLSQWKNGSGESFEGWGKHASLALIDGGEFQQWHIVAVQGHPFLKAVIKKVLNNIETYNPFLHGMGYQALWMTTGPIAYTLAIDPIRGLHPHRYLDIISEGGFQYSIYGRDGEKSHHHIFKSHYTSVYKPVVRINFCKKAGWEIINFFRNLKPLFMKH